jgi:hypothetical protein
LPYDAGGEQPDDQELGVGRYDDQLTADAVVQR